MKPLTPFDTSQPPISSRPRAVPTCAKCRDWEASLRFVIRAFRARPNVTETDVAAVLEQWECFEEQRQMQAPILPAPPCLALPEG
jgi:predicted nucleotidyltransferase